MVVAVGEEVLFLLSAEAYWNVFKLACGGFVPGKIRTGRLGQSLDGSKNCIVLEQPLLGSCSTLVIRGKAHQGA